MTELLLDVLGAFTTFGIGYIAGRYHQFKKQDPISNAMNNAMSGIAEAMEEMEDPEDTKGEN